MCATGIDLEVKHNLERPTELILGVIVLFIKRSNEFTLEVDISSWHNSLNHYVYRRRYHQGYNENYHIENCPKHK